MTFLTIILNISALIGLAVFTVFFWIGLFAILGWIGKGIRKVYRHFRPLPPKTEEEIAKEKEDEERKARYANTWSAGYLARSESADRREKFLEEQVQYQREQVEMWFNRYLDARFPEQRAAKRKAEQEAAEKAVESPLVEPDHSQAVIDTDE